MGRFYDILDFTLFEGVNKDSIAEFLKNASKKISSYKKGDIAIFQDSLCKSLSLLCQGTLLDLRNREQISCNTAGRG